MTVITAADSGNRYPYLLWSNRQEPKLVTMMRIRAAVVLWAVLLWAATPAIACLLPGFAPTSAERECCHHMVEHCGHSAMPASHSCCHVTDHPETMVVQGQANLPLKNAIAAVPAIPYVCLPAVILTSSKCLAFFESPPGQSPTGSLSVLRI